MNVTAGSIFPTRPFLDPPPEYGEKASAAVCILPVPYDATASYQPGARFAPAAIIAASHQVELFDEDLQCEPCRVGIHTCPAVPPNVSGPEAMVADVCGECLPLLNQNKFVVLLGGEHTVTLGAIDALRQYRNGRDFGVVQFDAHRDLRAEFEGCAWSHACVARRIVDWELPLVQVGVRAWSPEEQDVRSPRPIVSLTARALHDGDPATLFEQAIDSLPDEVYLTFDLDALDPAIMPATGTPEPGGLGWYTTLNLLDILTRQKRVIGMDVVELSPLAGLVAPDVLAARLTYKTIGLVSRSGVFKNPNP